jgi:hypothetical protein
MIDVQSLILIQEIETCTSTGMCTTVKQHGKTICSIYKLFNRNWTKFICTWVWVDGKLAKGNTFSSKNIARDIDTVL